MNERINIGRTIARERRRRNVTQEALAAHLGVSKAAVSKWELAQSLPDVSLLPRIAAFFQLTLDELFDWHDELSGAESAALYAEVYALAEQDLAAAHERLRALAAAHYSDANLLLMLASLLTVWAAGMATPFVAAPGQDGEAGGAGDEMGETGGVGGEALRTGGAGGEAGCTGGDAGGALPGTDALADEALALIDRVLEVATDPSILFLAQQQKATTLFQMGCFDEAASVLEPLVRRQDAGAPTMLLASAYRKLGRDDDALDLVQAERLRAANFVLSSLVQEVGMRDDAAFVRAAGAAATAVFEALDMGAANPFFPFTAAFEVAEALRRAGERDAALDALSCAVAAAAAIPASSGSFASPLWDRMGTRLGPAHAGAAWAEHKARQANDLREAMRREAAERATTLAWREFAGDDARYRDIVSAAARLSGEKVAADGEA